MNYTIGNELLTVTATERGAELQSILGSDGTEYLWQGDTAYWGDRAPNLFPYVARLTEGSYYLDGRLYQMDIHGLAPYLSFQLEEQTRERMVFLLTDNGETYRQYPRHFDFRVIYELRKNSLEITYQVDNRDRRTMYFGLGGHPGFRVPLAQGVGFEDYRLRFSDPCQPRRVGFTEQCFRNGEESDFPLEDGQVLCLKHDLFDEDAIVLKHIARQVTLETEKDGHSVTVSFPGMDYLGLWHWPGKTAPYICLEPWCSLPSIQDEIAEFERQPDLIALKPKERYTNCWSIRIGEI